MSDEVKHTPGPWEMRELPCDQGGNPSYRISGEPTLFLTLTECSDGYQQGQNKANAHLISAAPDLLAAMERLLDVIAEPNEIVRDMDMDNAVQAAADAIDKAKGA